ncbi:MAG: ABC transporter permease [Lachnospiraceae bacterium]|nr:ABC transporter permease [Lachnospiraceae bacterium]
MKQTFWAKIAFKNVIENRKFYIANLVVDVFTVTAFYLFTYMTLNPGLKAAPGYATLILVLSLGCVFVALITLFFKMYTNRILSKRRNREMGLYAAWGLEHKNIDSILFYETLYIYLAGSFLGLLIGFVFQNLVYDGLFTLMKCNKDYVAGFSFTPVWITLLVFIVIDYIILLSNMRKIRKNRVVSLLKEEDDSAPVKKLSFFDIIKGLFGLALIAGSYYYINSAVDFRESIEMIMVAIGVFFVGSYFVISGAVVMIEMFLKKRDKVYYKSTFFSTIAKLISRTKNNAMSLSVINILFTCVIIGASTTISLYLGTQRQASEAFKADGLVKCASFDDRTLCKEAIYDAAGEVGVTVEKCNESVLLGFQTLFDVENGVYSNEGTAAKDLPEVVEIRILPDFNRQWDENFTLDDGEILLVTDEDLEFKDYDTINFYGDTFKVKYHYDTSKYAGVDNIKYAYENHIIVKDFDTLSSVHEKLKSIGFGKELSYWCEYYVSGTKDDKVRLDNVLGDKLSKIASVDYFDSNATQLRTRYARNAIFLFLGCFISLIFIMYMVFIMYYKQIEEATDDAPNVLIMQKIGMYDSEIKRSIFVENGLLFFVPVVMAFCHVAACFGMMSDIMKLFMLTDIAFIKLCVVLFCLFILLVYILMYYGAYRVYIKIVLQKK